MTYESLNKTAEPEKTNSGTEGLNSTAIVSVQPVSDHLENSENAAYVFLLPTEILTNIFSLVSDEDLNKLSLVCKHFWRISYLQHLKNIAIEAANEDVNPENVSGCDLEEKFHRQNAPFLLRIRILSNPITQVTLINHLVETYEIFGCNVLIPLAIPFYTMDIENEDGNALEPNEILHNIDKIAEQWKAISPIQEGLEVYNKAALSGIYRDVMVSILRHPMLRVRLNEEQLVQAIVTIINSHEDVFKFVKLIIIDAAFTPTSLERLMQHEKFVHNLSADDFIKMLVIAHQKIRKGESQQADIKSVIQSILLYFNTSEKYLFKKNLVEIIALDTRYLLALLCCNGEGLKKIFGYDLFALQFHYKKSERFSLLICLRFDLDFYKYNVDVDAFNLISQDAAFFADRLEPHLNEMRQSSYKPLPGYTFYIAQSLKSPHPQLSGFINELHRHIYPYTSIYPSDHLKFEVERVYLETPEEKKKRLYWEETAKRLAEETAAKRAAQSKKMIEHNEETDDSERFKKLKPEIPADEDMENARRIIDLADKTHQHKNHRYNTIQCVTPLNEAIQTLFSDSNSTDWVKLKENLMTLRDQLANKVEQQFAKGKKRDDQKINEAKQIAQNHKNMVQTIVKNITLAEREAAIKTCYQKSTVSFWTRKNFGKICAVIAATALGAVAGALVAGALTGGIGAIPGAILGGGAGAAIILGSGAGAGLAAGATTGTSVYALFKFRGTNKYLRNVKKEGLKAVREAKNQIFRESGTNSARTKRSQKDSPPIPTESVPFGSDLSLAPEFTKQRKKRNCGFFQWPFNGVRTQPSANSSRAQKKLKLD